MDRFSVLNFLWAVWLVLGVSLGVDGAVNPSRKRQLLSGIPIPPHLHLLHIAAAK
jgi:hypothetical protein